MNLTLSKDALRMASAPFAAGQQGGNFISSVDGRTPNFTPDIPIDGASFVALQVYNDGLKVYVAPGTIGGVIPLISGTLINDTPPPNMTMTGAGNEYVIVSVTGTWVLTPDGLFAKQLTNKIVVLSLVATAPTDADLLSKGTGSTFEFILAFYVDGVFQSQNGYGPISLYFEDDASNSGKLDCTVLYPGAA